MRRNGVSDDFHPGDLATTREIRHRREPHKIRFRSHTRGADARITRVFIVALLFVIVALFACLAMWLMSLGPLTGGPMVIPGRVLDIAALAEMIGIS